MWRRDYRDFVGGTLLAIFGLSFSGYALLNYELATLRNMGLGMFPAALGVLLAALGVAIALPALFRPGVRLDIPVKAPLLVLLSVASFAATVRYGLIPGIVSVTVISSLADEKVRPFGILGLCVALSLLSWLVFRVMLGLHVVMLRLPF